MVRSHVLKLVDGYGLGREDDWLSGKSVTVPQSFVDNLCSDVSVNDLNFTPPIAAILARATNNQSTLSLDEIAAYCLTRVGTTLWRCVKPRTGCDIRFVVMKSAMWSIVILTTPIFAPTHAVFARSPRGRKAQISRRPRI